jgi:hypothetical protein
MRPFTGERTMARGGFMLDRADQQEATFGKVRALNESADKTVNSILKKMGKAALAQQTSGGMPVTQGAKRKLADYQLGLGNLASSGLRGEGLSNAIDKLNTSMFGQRGQIPPGMSALKAELIDSDMKSRQELAMIAKENEEQKAILQDQYKAQLKQIKLQEDMKLGGDINQWQAGGGGMMTQMAKRMNIMRFARKTGNVELGGRMALGLNQNIEQLTGKRTTFGRDLAIRGREMGIRRDLTLAGRAMGGDAGRFILGQRGRAREGAITSVDSIMKPERGLGGIKRATAASGMQMKQMGPVLKTAFTQALNGAGVTQTLQRINETMVRMAHLQSQIKGGRGNISHLKGEINRETTKYYGGKASGYVPNFAGVMMNNQEKLVRNYRQKMERAKVQGSGGYTAGQKGAAVPRWAGGFNPRNDAIFNPGMMAGGYVPNFAASYFKKGGNYNWQEAIDVLKRSRRTTNPYQVQMNRKRIQQMYQMALKAGRPELIQQLEFATGRRFGGMMGGNRGATLVNETAARAREVAMGRETTSSMRTNQQTYSTRRRDVVSRAHQRRRLVEESRRLNSQVPRRGRVARGRSSLNQWSRGQGNWLGKYRNTALNLKTLGGGQSFQAKELARYNKIRNAGNLGRHTSFLRGGLKLGGMGARGLHIGGMAGRGAMLAGRGLFGAASLIPAAGDMIGRGAGMLTEGLVGRKLNEDDKTVFGGWGDIATDMTGTTNIFRAGKAAGGTISGLWNSFGHAGLSAEANRKRKLSKYSGARDTGDAALRKKWMLKRRQGLTRQSFPDWRRDALGIKMTGANSASRRMGAANGYIPNFAMQGYGRHTDITGLFGGAAKQIQKQQEKDIQDFSKFGAPGMGHLFKSQYYGAAMNTPGLRGEMLRRMGVTGGEAFKTYPKTGSFHANGYIPNFYGGIAASQARERRQSGRSDVYTKMINGFGPATFNGSERGMENMIVRNHPDPRNAGMAEGHVPNFANLSKDLKAVSENIGLLNENMSMSGGGGGGQTSGNLSINMGEMRVSLYGGNPSQELQTNLVDQLSVFQNEVRSTLSAMAPDTYAAMKGPPVV